MSKKDKNIKVDNGKFVQQLMKIPPEELYNKFAHGKKGLCDQGRTAEDKGIDPSKIRGYFPKSHKQNKKKCPCSQDNVFFFFLPCKILFLLSGNFRHFH